MINVKSEIKPLKKVLLHRPGEELLNLTPDTFATLLFDDIPYLKIARQEHDEFAKILRDNGVEVVYLEDLVTEVLDSSPEIKDKFINRIEKDINPRYKMSYTPLESNDKDGYNLNMQLDYGILNKDEKNSEVYRYILDIDSYVRDIDKINDLKKVSSEILQLKNKDFEIYVGELQEKFLDVMISRNSKSEFDENIKKFGIIHGVNYGKQL